MLTITQMRRLTGVSRRTLQDYDALGLLKHRDTTPGGYWLYADEDVERLSVIQMLHHFGYTRKEIGEVIDDPGISLNQLLDRAQASLERKRDHISGLLNHIRFIRLQQELPPITIQAVNRGSMAISPMPLMDALEALTGSMTNSDLMEEAPELLPLLLHVSCLLLLDREPPESQAVADCVENMLRLVPEALECTPESAAENMLLFLRELAEDNPGIADRCDCAMEAIRRHAKGLPGAAADGKASE